MNKLLFLIATVAMSCISSASYCLDTATGKTVTMSKEQGYYRVDIDLSVPRVTRKDAGIELGRIIKKNVSNYEELIDSYFKEFLNNNTNYTLMIERMNLIWPNVPSIVRDEIDGMAQSICSTDKNILGDGLLSPDEMRLLNLIPDVFRATNCSAVGVLPVASESGKLLVARNVDWDDGKTQQLSRIQSVVKYHLPNNCSLTNVSYLGLAILLTGIGNNDGYSGSEVGQTLFQALLDSDIGVKFTIDNKRRSYAADLRAYAEQTQDMTEMCRLLDSTARDYTFGHLIFLADKNTLGVYEDNLTFAESKLRTVKDNPDLYIPWKIPGTIGAVNCFMLKSSLDNTVGVDKARISAVDQNLQTGDNALYVGNLKRWASQQRIFAENGTKHSFKDLQILSGYGPGKATDGFIYRPSTQQITVIEPISGRLSVAFHPVGREITKDEKPQYIDVPLTK